MRILPCMIGVIFLVVAGWAPPSRANLITNGSFELGTDPGSSITLLGGDTTTITGWTVGGFSINYIGSYWNAQEGSRSIELNGADPSGPGSISQTFTVTPNTTYKVEFYLSTNPGGGPVVKTLRVQVGSQFAEFPFPSLGYTVPNLLWVPAAWTFITGPGQTSATLTFSSLTPGAFGPAIDNINVTATPLPATAWLLGSGLLGLIGLKWRRRKT